VIIHVDPCPFGLAGLAATSGVVLGRFVDCPPKRAKVSSDLASADRQLNRLAHHIAVIQHIVGSHRALQRRLIAVAFHHLIAACQMTMRSII
jgi:hypothetical protein